MTNLIDTPPLFVYPGYIHKLTQTLQPDQIDLTEFAPVPGYKNYVINDTGDVFSWASRKSISWEMNLKLYWRFQAYNGGARSHLFVHRIVALIFKVNPNPRTHIEVNHIDYDTLNPRAPNLEWVTPAYNKEHRKLKPWMPVNPMGVIDVDCPF